MLRSVDDSRSQGIGELGEELGCVAEWVRAAGARLEEPVIGSQDAIRVGIAFFSGGIFRDGVIHTMVADHASLKCQCGH